MYKKFASLFLMVSLSLFIFNLSHAEETITITFEEGKYQVYSKQYNSDYSSYNSDLSNLENLTANYRSPSLSDFVWKASTFEGLPYVTIFSLIDSNAISIYFTSKPLLSGNSNNYALNFTREFYTESGENTLGKKMSYNLASNTWGFSGSINSADTMIVGSNNFVIYYANYDIYNRNNNSLVCKASSVEEQSPSMQNPLTDEEIKSILQIFLDSVRNADLPEHYGRYVLTYNQETGQYRGFVYPSYINLGLQYINYNEDGTVTVPLNSTGDYYRLIIHNEEENYLFVFFDAIEMLYKKPLFYEFTSNSTNTLFNFNTTYLITGDIPFSISTVNEPIIYTSHKIYSLFLVDESGFGTFEVDEETSVEKQEFINSETGLPEDTTINEYTEEISSDVNILSFIKLLFEFIYALVSFLARFFTFIITFIMVPASTKILPQEFVTGIDWIHSFAFGDILLWEIFSILFGVLLSLYIVKLIRSH